MYYRMIDGIADIEAREWDRLNRGGYPFVRHSFLDGLERTGCVCPASGWRPRHILLYDDANCARLLGASPLYLKDHSWGEYVFDWGWADAYQRAGLRYYPKLLCAIPFTPASGPRLLVSPGADDPQLIRRALIRAILADAERLEVSSVHWLFTDADDTRALLDEGLLKRSGSQFHWRQRGAASFDEFLASLTSKRRKQVRRERRQVAEAGVTVRMIEGHELGPGDWNAMHQFYQNTIRERGAIPYLSRQFFHHLGEHMAGDSVMAMARDTRGTPIAGALYLKGDDTLYGRYWGATAFYKGLHFETCYYQPIDYCLQHGISKFEAGAQGEHKLHRGLVPSPTYSAHWLAHPRFADAVREFLEVETRQVEQYANALDRHNPFHQ